jgi:hypothetical protein
MNSPGRLRLFSALTLAPTILLLVDMFGTWQAVSIEFGGEVLASASRNGWHGFWGILLGLLTILFLPWLAVQIIGAEVGRDRLMGLITLGFGVVIFACVVVKVLTDDYSAWASYVAILLGFWVLVCASLAVLLPVTTADVPIVSGMNVESQAVVHSTSQSNGECANCRWVFGREIVCQFCGQVEGLPVGIAVSSPARRLGGYLLGIVLLLVTLYIGYMIWCFIIYDRGQTPAKQLLGMRVVRLETGRRATWGTMFLRGWICAPLVELFSALLLYIPLFWPVWDKRNQALWDKMLATIVVNDRAGIV